MGLQKLTIQPAESKSGVKKVEVMFNPSEYTLYRSVPWHEHNIQGYDAPVLEFTTGECYRADFELLFDGYENHQNVREQIDEIEKYALVDPELHRPPVALLVWGTALNFKCVLEKIQVRYTLFKDDGTPLRAVVNTTWKEFSEANEQLQAKPRHSADHTKRRVVKQGETLSWIAGKEYDDPSLWRVIADANGIDDPMQIEPGTELVIPAIV
ncbi:MAG: LysM peptidoglycan-binding domain-containing protein [Planctomycetota bacterium]|nr:MAG: LysM peptidoglycan-binding domain-containing protein [Planctomycetota bacterium]